ncbi:hypothetical protein LSAT2_017753 [Lamellibrachia satsuma]|nr:hypothetical protein LSAT2_017753 [Lamellibrachia satsuma]
MGSSVSLTCGISGDLGSDVLQWQSFAVKNAGEQIYNSNTGTVSDSNKYEVSDTYTLTVKDLMIADGGLYICDLVGLSGDKKSAAVIVIAEPMISIEPRILDVGKTATVKCTSDFGSPLESDMNYNEIPKMSLWIGGTKAKDNSPIWSKDRGQKSILSYSGNHTAKSGDQEQVVRCRVTTSTPSFTSEITDTLKVKYPVTNAKYVPNKKVFYLGETVNCTADGYPLPRFTWLPLRSRGGREVRSSVLKITENMIGDNEWKCTATSDYTPNPVIIIAKFTVEGASNNPDGTPIKPVSTGPEGASNNPDGTPIKPVSTGSGSQVVTVVTAVAASVVILVIVGIVLGLTCRNRRSTNTGLPKAPLPGAAEDVVSRDRSQPQIESSVYEEIGAVEQPSHIYRVVESPETTYEKMGVVGQPNHTYAVVESQETKYEKIGAVGQPNNVYDHLS